MRWKIALKALVVAAILAPASLAGPKILGAVEVAKVWSGHPVVFSLLTRGKKQYVAYYDDQRNMVVAQRDLSSTEWTKMILPTKVGWDSHNSVTMANSTSSGTCTRFR